MQKLLLLAALSVPAVPTVELVSYGKRRYTVTCDTCRIFSVSLSVTGAGEVYHVRGNTVTPIAEVQSLRSGDCFRLGSGIPTCFTLD
jgi:hypothetical protein